MKYYTTNRAISNRAKDILTRILFVLIAAAVIFFSAVVIGHHLLRKAEEAGQRPSDTAGAGWSPEKTQEDPENAAGSAPTVRACGIDPLAYETTEELYAALSAASVSYDSILFPLSGGDGSLIYQSPAVCALARVPLSDKNPADTVRASLNAAKMYGLRVLVSVTPSEAVTDKALFEELASWGADEILVTPNFSGAIDYESANLLRLYLIDCAAELEDMQELFGLAGEFDATTVSGWVVEQLGRIPAVGDSFTYENLFVRVTQVEATKVLEINVRKNDPEKDEAT